MSEITKENFIRAKDFCNFDSTYAKVLPSIKDDIMQHSDSITNAFYERLANDPVAAAIVSGRIDKLKATHKIWMEGLFCGDYGDTYFEQRYKIGVTHVNAKIDPFFVEVITSFLRRQFSGVLASNQLGLEAALAILDLDTMIIIGAYHEDRMKRMSDVTGMNQSLLERLMSFKA